MDWSAAIFLFIVLATLMVGVWVGLALLVSAAIVIVLFTNIPLGGLMAQYTMNIIAVPDLVALPLFIIMGEFLFRTKMSEALFTGLAPWAGLLPGRLLHVNTIACTVFASISGSSAATTQVVGRMSLTQLLKRGYNRGLSIGSLAGAGTLGLLIPPSTIMIIYGVLAQESVLRLFAAGLFPGLLLAGMFVAFIAICAIIKPDIVPDSERKLDAMPLRERLRATSRLFPVLCLMLLVLVSMYTGVATPTEAAALGCVGAAIVDGIGATVLPQTVARSLRHAEELTIVPIAPVLSMPISVCIPDSAGLSDAAYAVHQIAVATLAEVFAGGPPVSRTELTAATGQSAETPPE